MRKRILAGVLGVLMLLSVALPAVLAENLSYGSEGDQVTQAQMRLAQLGYYSDKVDGKYGYSTYTAVRAFQAKNGLVVDGVLGEQTNMALFKAGAIANDGTPAATSGYQRLAIGSVGPAVKTVQGLLRNRGYYVGDVEGKYGYSTYLAVVAFQTDEGLVADGVVGPLTWSKLTAGVVLPPPPPPPPPKPVDPSTVLLKLNDTGALVKQAQQRLAALGYYKGAIDSKFGYGTYLAVRDFQKLNGLKVDGIIGPLTWAKLFDASAVPKDPTIVLAPVIDSLTSIGKTIYLKWSASVGAKSYYIYRSVNGGAFTFLKGTVGLEIADSGLTYGNTYEYKIRANGNKGNHSAMSAVKGMKLVINLPTPVISSLGNSNTTTATLVWGNVAGATSYYIYRSVNGGAYAFLKGTNVTSIKDAGLTMGSKYAYKVKANGPGGAVSPLSAAKEITIAVTLPAPVISSLTNGSTTTATLVWGKVAGATSYSVYRSVNGGAFALLKGTVDNTIKDAGLTMGDTYAYKVQAKAAGGVLSAMSAAKEIKMAVSLATPVISSLAHGGTTTATLVWGKVTNATSYSIFRAVNGGAFVYLKGTVATSIKDAGLTSGDSYAYRVQANGPGSIKSALSNVKSFVLK